MYEVIPVPTGYWLVKQAGEWIGEQPCNVMDGSLPAHSSTGRKREKYMDIKLKAPIIPIYEATCIEIKEMPHSLGECNTIPSTGIKNTWHARCPECGKYAHKYGSHRKNNLWTCDNCGYNFATPRTSREVIHG